MTYTTTLRCSTAGCRHTLADYGVSSRDLRRNARKLGWHVASNDNPYGEDRCPDCVARLDRAYEDYVGNPPQEG